MAQVYKKLEIDVNKEVTSIITAVQNDTNSRYLDVVLLDGSTAINLTGHEVRIYGKKGDGTEFYNNGGITNATAGRCQFELTSQALAVAQDLEVQIILFKNNVEVLSTQPFKIHVVKSLFSKNAIESSNEYGALVVLYQNLYEAYDLMTTMVQNIGVPGEIAEQLTIDTMWDAWEYLCNYVSEDLTTLIQNAINNNSVDGVVQRIGETTDTGGTSTAGTMFAKLNNLINFNSGFKEVRKIKSSAVTAIPAPVSSGSQPTVSFSVVFDTPVTLDYVKVDISNVSSGYGDRSGLYGQLKITYYDNTTRSTSLISGSWNYTYYSYLSSIFSNFVYSYGTSPITTGLQQGNIPSSDLEHIKKVEIINAYHTNGITSISSSTPTGTCSAVLSVFYRECIKIS